MAAEKNTPFKKKKSMQALQDRILSEAVLFSPSRKILIALFCIVLMGAGFYFPVFQHRLEELAKYRKHLVFQKRLFGAYQKKAGEFDGLSRQMQAKNHQFLAAAAALPHKRHSARLLDAFSRAGKAANVNLLSIREEREIALDFYQKVPWAIQASGSYVRLMDFLLHIASLDRMVIIETMELKREKRDSLIYMECRAAAFTCGE